MSTPEQNRRQYSRLKLQVPVELILENATSPLRGATADLSASGCYIESIFPHAVGTKLGLKLRLDDTLNVQGTVVTRDPQVGNGIQFETMAPEDAEKLRAFLEAAEKEKDAAEK
jgi:c-di-GMP-binding flagellar brake protein YcgR